ncbi:ABC transporter permease [Paenibacillus humicola]|uniref:ABC transporter permease n=1 Tax=Paenibacillus humicola TaxID=3110540 RepID=UPI00237C4AFA|nr:ABC transporter permease [Paenibacillus humicola]
MKQAQATKREAVSDPEVALVKPVSGSDGPDRARPKRTSGNWSVWGGRIAVGVVLLGIWQLLSGTVINEFWFSKPSLIAGRIIEIALTGELWRHLGTTLEECLAGMAIGMVAGTLLGIAAAFGGIVDKWLHPYVMAIYSLPRVALAPLFIVWFGIGFSSKVIMVVAMVLFVAFYNSYEGIKNIDHSLLDMMKTYKANRTQVMRWVILPSITVWIFTSLRLNIGMALIGSVIAEMVGANKGLGYYITYSSSLLDTTGIYTGLVLIMLIALVLEQIIVQFERRLLRYR